MVRNNNVINFTNNRTTNSRIGLIQIDLRISILNTPKTRRDKIINKRSPLKNNRGLNPEIKQYYLDPLLNLVHSLGNLINLKKVNSNHVKIISLVLENLLLKRNKLGLLHLNQVVVNQTMASLIDNKGLRIKRSWF